MCVDSTQTCPVTDLVLLTEDSLSTDPRLNDASYTKKSGTSFGTEKIYLVYTSSSNERSNSPLQSLAWELNSLCAFTDQANVVKKASNSPVYYPLEAKTNLKDCQDFYATEANEDTQVAEDKRYTDAATDLQEQNQSPNEYSIETASGVFATLSAMPNFARYVPNAEVTK